MDRIKKVIDIMKLDVKHIDTVPESYSSEVGKLTLTNNEKVILKIPYNKTKLLKEYKMLQLLEKELPVAQILDFWEGNDIIPGALMLSYIKGKPPTDIVDKNIAFQMGGLLAKLHNIKIDKNKLLDMGENIYNEREEWWQTIKRWFEDCVDDCREVLDLDLLNRCISLFYYYYENLPEPDYPSIVHMDYRPGNILVHDSKINGVLDFESSRIGSADIDFSKMKIYVWDLYDNTKEEFLNGYKEIRKLPDLDKTLPFYLLFNAFSGVSWCIKRGKTTDDFYMENMLSLKDIVSKGPS